MPGRKPAESRQKADIQMLSWRRGASVPQCLIASVLQCLNASVPSLIRC